MSTPTLEKIATVPVARQRLRREAAALRRAAHPNVVRMASFVDLAERTELRIDHAGDHTLVSRPPTDGPTALALGASLAATLADLHAMGVAHGRLTADHVLVGPDGRAVLCGLSGASERGDTEGDVRALAILLDVLATSVPSPGSRRDRRAVATLLAVADQARTAEPAPAASEVARLLGAPSARAQRHRPRAERRRPGPDRSPRTERRRPPTVVIVSASAAAVLLLAWLAASTLRPSRDPSVFSVAPPSLDDGGATENGVGDEELVRFSVDGATYAAGSPGDIVVTGDWNCDGIVGAALLRPSTGAVYVFDHLAAPDAAVDGRLLADATGAVALEAVEQPDGCHALVARHADGQVEVLAVTP